MLSIFPEEWFTALYPKTGVTGPPHGAVGPSTFLYFKEYFLMEHDFYALVVVLGGLIKNVIWARRRRCSGTLDRETSTPVRTPT